jgi:hypothetical protein
LDCDAPLAAEVEVGAVVIECMLVVPVVVVVVVPTIDVLPDPLDEPLPESMNVTIE